MKAERINLDNELGIVNSARVSFNAESKELNAKDEKLINYLASHQHISTFFHNQLYFIISEEQRQAIYNNVNSEFYAGFECAKFDNGQIGVKVSLYNYLKKIELFKDAKRIKKGFSKNLLNRYNCADVSRLYGLSFRIECPIFVRNQLDRHRVGIAINELSRRYVRTDIEIYKMGEFRNQSESNKQGSEGICKNQPILDFIYNSSIEESLETYNTLIDRGVCGEQARAVLPMSTITKFVWSGSLYAFCRMLSERLERDAQKETRDLAYQIYDILCREFSVNIIETIIKDIKKTKKNVFKGLDIVKELKEIY